ncbi:ephexin-1-like protein [Dinothrombium tinctorium]|uniref:Ephexin-1-like protein n=1 Tax=Dinothrombium tinctorium TaxID=1965070 RepID=A0A443RDC6_9ACAR|nr:ephexin-1-like protein [Dinothrombium tinctorium]
MNWFFGQLTEEMVEKALQPKKLISFHEHIKKKDKEALQQTVFEKKEPLYQLEYDIKEFLNHKVDWPSSLLPSNGENHDAKQENYNENQAKEQKNATSMKIKVDDHTLESVTLWSQHPKVVESGILNKLSKQEIKLQEAMYEVMCSEASYLKSLHILINHFYRGIEFMQKYLSRLSKNEFDWMFSNVTDIALVSESLLFEHEERWKGSILMHDVCEVLLNHIEQNFHVYEIYCENYELQKITLKRLSKQNSAFALVLKRLENDEICQKLSFQSFLFLPIHRITKYKILIDAIIKQLPKDSTLLESCKSALTASKMISRKCDMAIKNGEFRLSIGRLKFKRPMPKIPLSRNLIKAGEVICTSLASKDTLTLETKTVNLYCFPDLILIADTKR